MHRYLVNPPPYLHRLWIPLTQNLCILLLTICNEQRIQLFIMAVNDFWQRNQINNHYSIWTLFIFQIWLIFVSQPSAQQQVLLSPLLRLAIVPGPVLSNEIVIIFTAQGAEKLQTVIIWGKKNGWVHDLSRKPYLFRKSLT